MNAPSCQKKHILVVDDEPLVSQTVAMLLQSDGHLVTQVSSAAEALAIFQPGKFDLVFTDHFMPLITGAQLAAAIKERSPAQPVILVTAYPEKLHSAARALASPDCLIGKPFHLKSLREAIERLSPAAQDQKPTT